MEKVSEIKAIPAPFSKQLNLQKVEYENGFQMMRIRIKEGKRFTMIDLDVNTATELSESINEWLEGLK